MTWEPIETAPKDGKPLDLWAKHWHAGSDLQRPDTAPLGVNVSVLATDGKREKWFPDCKRFFALGPPRFIGLPDGWHARAWTEQPDPEPREAA